MKWISHRVATALGWEFEGELPSDPKLVVIGAPHTSNWDFFLFLAAIHHLQVEPRFLGKHTLFRGPLGAIFRALGGIPVDRTRPGGVVGQVQREFDRSERMILVIAPEGTRSVTRTWKSGFIEIALASGVRIVPAGIDFPTRRVTIGSPVTADDKDALMAHLRRFYADKQGRHPGLVGPVELRAD